VSARDFLGALDEYDTRDDTERDHVARIRALEPARAWNRSEPLHVTASALVTHPATRRVLLRWHERMQSWLQVGGHGDRGETDPFAIASREAWEETGLADLRAWPDPSRPVLLHVVVVPVPPRGDDPAHEHADFRYLLATDAPDAIAQEHDAAPLRWCTVDQARALIAEDNLCTTIARAEALW
jgi:8-oxo-dGTP pyrophosphatase MutT (NUDIX family)